MSKPSSWIKLNRNIIGWRWYQDANTFRVFIHLLLSANVTDNDFKTTTIHRGELATSIGHIAADLGITYNQTRTALEHLRQTNEITTKTMPKYIVISIVNYDKYQARHTETAGKTQADHNQTTSKSQQYKNIRIKEDKNNYILPKGNDEPRSSYGGVYLADSEFEELESMVEDKGEFLNVLDRVAEWLKDNPRPKSRHKGVVKTFLKNEGLIK